MGEITRRRALLYGRDALLVAGLGGMLAAETGTAFARATPDATALNVVTSWTNNTFSGATEWVQDFVFNIAVTADGAVYTNSFWDEAHQYAGIYKDGQVVGNCSGANGDAIAVNADYAYATVGNGLTRFTLAGAETSLSFSVGSPPAAAAASATQVVATDRVNNEVKVFDAATGALQSSWAVNQPGAVAIAANGDIWVVENITRTTDDAHFWQIDAANPAKILRFSNSGTALSGTISGPSAAWIPTSLAIDAKGDLLVGDNGPLRQVHTYTGLSGTPALGKSLGLAGGIGAGVPGQPMPDKFFGICGVGGDSAGNVYVALFEFGVWIRKFDPNGNLVWQVQGSGFVKTADFDPATDGVDVYTTQTHFHMNYSKAAGSQATWVGYSLDSLKYPQDGRLYLTNHEHEATTPFLRRLNGEMYMYVTGMYAGNLLIYKFEGEIAKPSGAIFKKPWTSTTYPAWPPNQPATGEYIWRDMNGNGNFDAGEFIQTGTGADAPSNCWVWFVDVKGNIWEGGDRNLRYFPLQGFDSQGNPMYDYASMKTIALPAPFTIVRRLHYDVTTDTMYMSGYTAAEAYDNAHWKEAGKVLVRYDKWSTGNTTPTWTTLLPWDVTDTPVATIVGLAWAGDYIFLSGIETRGEVWALKAADGSMVGDWLPGANVGGQNETGWGDITYPIAAFERANGQYLINLEDDQWNKVLLYEWTP